MPARRRLPVDPPPTLARRSRAGATAAAWALLVSGAVGQRAVGMDHNPTVQVLRAGSPASGALAGAFPTIQEAVDAALPGDTVQIPAGLFTGPGNRAVSVTKTITLLGAGPGQTILDCEGAARGFEFAGTSTAKLEALTIRNGAAPTGLGGGILVSESASPALRELEIHGCSAGVGGAISGRAGQAWDAEGLYLHGNSATTRGGAIQLLLPLGTLRGLRIEDNTGLTGGGIELSGVLGPDPQGSVRIESSFFRGNSAIVGGGALHSLMADLFFVDRCTFVENTTTFVGGAILVEGDPSLPTPEKVFFQNSLIARNTAAVNGGGLLALETLVIVQNCTIADNESGGSGTGGLAVGFEGALILNTILWGNRSPNPNVLFQQLAVETLSSSLFLYNDVEGGAPDPTSLSADPLFVDPASGDYHLGRGSPCVNAGLPGLGLALTQLDIDGEPRIMSNEIDIGADERVADRRPLVESPAPGTR